MDAIGGGGWGPVGTTSLLSSGRLEPRKVVGSIDTSEFVVAIGGSLGFLFALGSQGINFGYRRCPAGRRCDRRTVRGLAGAAPAARVLGVAAGGLIVLTNIDTIVKALGGTGAVEIVVAVVVAAVWVLLVAWAVQQERVVPPAAAERGRAGRRA